MSADLSAQKRNKSKRDSTLKKASWMAFPFAFYLPETRWAGGAAGIVNFHVNKKDTVSPPSQIQMGFAYTQNKQFLFYLPYQLYFNERKWTAKGEIGYYKYSYNFYGIGNDIEDDDKELYYVNFPRINMNFYRKVSSNYFVGLRSWYENYLIDQNKFEEGKNLETGLVPGSQGGVVFGLGLVSIFDTRDNIYFPQKGIYFEMFAHNFSNALGSDYQFDKYRLDFRYFTAPHENHTIAFQLYLDHITGDVPFNQMSMMGGGKRMRGYFEGKFRNKNKLETQLEYRPKIYGRLGGALFLSYGMVAPEIEKYSLSLGHLGYGAGLRYTLDPVKKVNIRLDAAFGPDTHAFYFTFSEAF